MDEIFELWNLYNMYANKLSEALGRTRNIVGEYAEYLASLYYKGTLLPISGSSADFKTTDGKLYQVKSRKVDKLSSVQLNVIRSWSFDILVVVLFNEEGSILKALEVPVSVAKKYGKQNKHQNGWIITTNRDFLNDKEIKDITIKLTKLTN